MMYDYLHTPPFAIYKTATSETPGPTTNSKAACRGLRDCRSIPDVDKQPLRLCHQCNRPATSKIIEHGLVIFSRTASPEKEFR